jgi:hypothetical protein
MKATWSSLVGVVFILSADSNERPNPVVSSGTGSATVQVDDVSNLVTILSGTYENMNSVVTLAHIHGLADENTPAGIIMNLTPTGGLAGTFTGSEVLSPANVAGILAGLSYINVHTSTNPGGEIRGQLRVIPEPGAGLLLGLAGAGLVLRRRRR